MRPWKALHPKSQKENTRTGNEKDSKADLKRYSIGKTDDGMECGKNRSD